MTLYELSEQLQVLAEMAEDPEVSAETLLDTMEAVEGEFEAKAEGYAKVMAELKGRSEMPDAEIKRLQMHKKACDSNRDRIEDRLMGAMIATGKTKFETDLFSFSVRKTPGTLQITDESQVDIEFLVPQKPQIDKTGIRNAIKAGKEFAWCHIEPGQTLSIR